jgi:hypothetical protein
MQCHGADPDHNLSDIRAQNHSGHKIQQNLGLPDRRRALRQNLRSRHMTNRRKGCREANWIVAVVGQLLHPSSSCGKSNVFCALDWVVATNLPTLTAFGRRHNFQGLRSPSQRGRSLHQDQGRALPWLSHLPLGCNNQGLQPWLMPTTAKARFTNYTHGCIGIKDASA